MRLAIQTIGRCGAILRGVATLCAVVMPGFALAVETSLTAPGAPEDLQDRLRGSSAALSAEERGLESVQEMLAASLSDYRTLVQILYDEGYFSPVVHIRLDGREAAYIKPLNLPRSVAKIEIQVTTGPAFQFGRAGIAPLAAGTVLPETYQSGQRATTGAIRNAAIAGIDGWRAVGHAKVKVGGQKITANSRAAVLDADITLAPGPKLAFGKLTVTGQSRVRTDAMARIAGFPTGEVYSPEQVQKVGTRLRRTGAFSSVSIKEGALANPNGTLDFEATVEDQPLRRISFGVELSSSNGLDLSAKWTHRNLWGAAERFQFEAAIRNLGGVEDVDGRLGLRLDLPAKLGPDDNMFYLADLERRNRTHYDVTRGVLGVGVRRVFSDSLYGEISLGGGVSIADDAFGNNRRFNLIALPVRVEWDRRNDKVNATDGFYLDTRVMPFAGLSGTDSGGRLLVDARGYQALTKSGSIILAGRVQIGSVVGASLADVTPEYLFFSGGAGSVRGQPYESLGIPVGVGVAGGRSMLALSGEMRGRITEKISLVGFFDFGAVDASSFVDKNSIYHSGAGLGLRYDLGGFGPLRLDLAVPVEGTTGEGLQFYVGIGQAF
ncbi:MAG: translocation and assembly module TamA [Paracoccaceae bacterium]|jgi:translocation and assembly module TamA